jgi:hypothetical protein
VQKRSESIYDNDDWYLNFYFYVQYVVNIYRFILFNLHHIIVFCFKFIRFNNNNKQSVNTNNSNNK